jgi:hypothetical protein
MGATNIGSRALGAFVLGSAGVSTVVQSTPDGLYVVSFSDVNPPLRNDGKPWEILQVSESAALAGPWTLIDTQQIVPVDADPSQPAERNFTTTLATLAEGFYSLTFFDAQGGASHPQVQVQDNPSAIKPSLSDLGSFMRERTVAAGSGGGELGTFTASTRPTAAEAEVLLEQATAQVLMQVGAEIPDRAIQQAKFLVLVYAAQLVELGFYRNEVSRDQSAYPMYVQMFKDSIMALQSFISDEGPAAPAPSFFSVPVASASQQRFQAIVGAVDPATGIFDPTKLPVDQWYPRGYGGIPANLLQLYPWLGFGDTIFGSGDDTINELESD